MNKINNHHYIYFGLLFLLNSCTNPSSKTEPANKSIDSARSHPAKPGSNYSDTLTINNPAAVFYYPDSLQLKKTEEMMDTEVFKSCTHEFFYQMRNAHMVIKNNRPGLKIIEAKNVRYILFNKINKESICIDLDTKNDIYGLLLFDTKKNPQSADMMNIDTELWFYFAAEGKQGKSK